MKNLIGPARDLLLWVRFVLTAPPVLSKKMKGGEDLGGGGRFA
jgi:hypothetical protein